MGIALKYLRELLEKIGIELDKRTATSLLVLLLLLISLPIGLFLIKNQLTFLPKAEGELIQLGEGGCIKVSKDKKKVVDCPLVPIKLINPFFNTNIVTATPSGSAGTGSLSPSASVTASGGSPRGVNVKSFNNNIQQALDSIKVSGGSVYVPAGTYKINEKVRLYSNTTLFGDGMGATIIKLADNIPVDDLMANDSTSGQQNIVIRDLTLQGPDIPRIADKGHGLRLENIDKAYVINVEINDVMMDGIYLGYKTKDGSPKGVTNVRISGCKVNRSQRQQIGLIMGSNVVIDGCTIDGTNKFGQQSYVGIDLEPDDATTPVSNSFIIGNKIASTNIGIALNGANGESRNAATVHDNKVCGNSVSAISVAIADSGQNNQISDTTCEIPAALANLPPPPSKPSAKNTSFRAGLVKIVSAQDSDDVFLDGEDSDSEDKFINDGTSGTTGGTSNTNTGMVNPGSDKLLYRLAETQSGLLQAPWREFALLPTQSNLAGSEYREPLLLSGWLNRFFSNFTRPVAAQDNNVPNGCVKITPQSRSVRYKNCQEADAACNNQTNLVASAGENDKDPAYKFDGVTVASYPVKESVWQWTNGWKSHDFKGPRQEDGDRIKIKGSKLESPNGGKIFSESGSQQMTGGAVQVTYGDGAIVEYAYTKQGTNLQGLPGQTYDPGKSYAYVPNDPNSNTKCAPQNAGGNNGGGGGGNNAGGNNGGGAAGNGGTNTGGGTGAGGNGTGAAAGTGGAGAGGTGTSGAQGPVSSGTPSFSIGSQFINTTFQLKDIKPGTKQIWVQFLHPDGTTRVDNVTFELVEKTPQILGLACNLDISKENLKITIEGEHFGNAVGTVESVTPALKPEVLGWNDKLITAFLKKPSIPINEGQRFKIKITRTDGFGSATAVCAVDKSLVSLGARIFCREPGKFDAQNVAVTLLYNPGDPASPNKINKVEEKVTIGKDGEIENLKTKLQVDKNYAIAIKAPYSVRRTATFTAQEGTTEILRSDGSPFILPIGDIAPPVSPDGRINTLDRSELIRQWRILGQGDSKLTGDFNRDSRVNSVDWACMNYDFGAEDEPIPTSVPQPVSVTLRIPGGEATITIPSSPLPSGSFFPAPSPSKDTSNSAKIDLGGKLFLDTNRNQIADIGESFISQGSAVVKLLQVPEEHVIGTVLTPEELADSKILTQVTNNLPNAFYDISVFVEKDSGTKFSILATANSGQLTGTVDFALTAPLIDSNQVVNIPLSSPTQ